MAKTPPRLPYELIPPSDDRLNQVAEAVPVDAICTPEVQLCIDGMLQIADGNAGGERRRTMIGLAAPQIGVLKRIIIVDIACGEVGHTPDFRVLINPAILHASGRATFRESCYSTAKVCGPVPRAAAITIGGYNRWALWQRLPLTAMPARVGQHEEDHLNGIRFPDVPGVDELHWVEPDDFGQYRLYWRNWPRHCPREVWTAMKADCPYREPTC